MKAKYRCSVLIVITPLLFACNMDYTFSGIYAPNGRATQEIGKQPDKYVGNENAEIGFSPPHSVIDNP